MTFFSTLNMERRTDQQTYLPVEIQFYISVMFLDLPDNIQEEKPSFFNFENNWLRNDQRTDGWTERPSYRDVRTHLKMAESLTPELVTLLRNVGPNQET